ncbi:MAG: cbb3-type cytochrome oxidase assembly protein CcoS [Rhodanobacter sp.]
MNVLLVLIPVTLLVIVIAVALFFWAVNHQQFDDLDSPAVLPLMDDPPTRQDPPPAEDADDPDAAQPDAARLDGPP